MSNVLLARHPEVHHDADPEIGETHGCLAYFEGVTSDGRYKVHVKFNTFSTEMVIEQRHGNEHLEEIYTADYWVRRYGVRMPYFGIVIEEIC